MKKFIAKVTFKGLKRLCKLEAHRQRQCTGDKQEKTIIVLVPEALAEFRKAKPVWSKKHLPFSVVML